MAGAFAITTTTSSVKLTPARTGQLQFTVTNTSGQQLTVRGVIVTPQGEDKKVWFTIDGQPERSCAPNTALAYKVNIAVPPEAPAGPLIVRFDALGVENPDVYSSQGPSVVLDVPPVSIPSKPFPWWIVAVAVLAVLLLGGGTGAAWYFTHQKTTGGKAAVSPTPTATTDPLIRFVGTWTNVVTASGDPGPRSVAITRSGNSLQASMTFSVCQLNGPLWCLIVGPSIGTYDPATQTVTFNWQNGADRYTAVASVPSASTLVIDARASRGYSSQFTFRPCTNCLKQIATFRPIRPT